MDSENHRVPVHPANAATLW